MPASSPRATSRRSAATLRGVAAGPAGLLLALGLLTGCSDNAPKPEKDSGAQVATRKQVDDTVASLNAAATQQIGEKDYQAAALTMERALDLDPDNAEAHFIMGFVQQTLGDDAEASVHYAATLEAEPDNAKAVFNLAILTEQSDLRAAVALYRRAVRLDPTNAPAYVRLGDALNQLGETQQGNRLLRKGYELDPTLESASQ